MFTYSGKLLHIDLSKENIWEETLSQEYVNKFIGGRGINAALLWKWITPESDPLVIKNVLIFCA